MDVASSARPFETLRASTGGIRVGPRQRMSGELESPRLSEPGSVSSLDLAVPSRWDLTPESRRESLDSVGDYGAGEVNDALPTQSSRFSSSSTGDESEQGQIRRSSAAAFLQDADWNFRPEVRSSTPWYERTAHGVARGPPHTPKIC